jgi:hypothetical protein
MTAPNADGPTAAERPRLVIIVSPISPGHFAARLETTNELLVGSSRQPFLDAARVPISQGYDGNAILVMKYLGSDIIALKAPLAKAAKLGVEEGPNGPRFVPFRTGPKRRVAAPPMLRASRVPLHAHPNPPADASATQQNDDEE